MITRIDSIIAIVLSVFFVLSSQLPSLLDFQFLSFDNQEYIGYAMFVLLSISMLYPILRQYLSLSVWISRLHIYSSLMLLFLSGLHSVPPASLITFIMYALILLQGLSIPLHYSFNKQMNVGYVKYWLGFHILSGGLLFILALFHIYTQYYY